MAGKRLQGLDGLRGIAALAVVAYHYAENTCYYGLLGVELFFVISGFVILMTLDRVRTVREFTLHRFVRLYPTYWLSVLVASCTVAAPLSEILINLTMLQGFVRQPNLIDPYWTLAFELWFYVVMAALFVAGSLEYVDHLALIWLGAMSGLRILLSMGHLYWLFPNPTFRLLAMPLFGHLFIAGMMIYRITVGRRTWLTFGCLTLAVLYSAFGRPDWTEVSSLIYFPVNAVFIAAVWDASGEQSIFAWSPLTWIGVRSYSIYLLHDPVRKIALDTLGDNLAGATLGIALTLAFASLSWAYVERPAQVWIRRQKVLIHRPQ